MASNKTFTILITDEEGEVNIEMYDLASKRKMNITAEEVKGFAATTPVGMMKWATRKMKDAFKKTTHL